MHFLIDAHNGIAIYDQIARQLKFAIARDVIQSGEMVPSVRELSKKLAVNPNTVARAYRDLQNDGVLSPIRGTGLQITADAKSICQTDRESLIRERLRSVLQEAYQSGLSTSAIQNTVNQLIQELSQREGDNA
jgi:GntR family transcriptional regulator